MTGQIVRMPDIRKVDPLNTKDKLRQELLFAFHVVDMLGQPSGMGSHLTARIPGTDTFFFHIHNLQQNQCLQSSCLFGVFHIWYINYYWEFQLN